MRIAKLLTVLSALLCPLAASAAACPTGYAKAKAFVVSPQSAGGTLTAFPVLLPFNGVSTNFSGTAASTSFTVPDLKVAGSGGSVQSSTGLDIVFCDAYSSGNLLNFERVNYVSTTGAVEFYVGRTLSGSANTLIWMFYGKSGASDLSNSNAMWAAANYIFVQHMPNGSSLSIIDSTGNYSPTNHGATAGTGVIDGGGAFAVGSSQYIDAGAAYSATSVTDEVWVEPTTTGLNSGCSMAVEDVGASGLGTELGTYGCANAGSILWNICGCGSGSQSYLITNAGVAPAGVWTLLAATATNTPSFSDAIYVNGAAVTSFFATHSGGVVYSSTDHLGVGNVGSAGSTYWDGGLDEVRVSNVAQTAAWEAANYQAQSAPSSFALMLDADTPSGMSSGAYCVPVTVAHANVASTLSDFPLLVHGIYPWMADVTDGGFAVNGNSGHDIRWFSNSTCTTGLDFERVYWTSATGESSWRVHVPSLSSSSDTTVYVKIGASADTSDLSTLWMGSYNYAGVYDGGSPASVDTLDSGGAGLNFGCGASVASIYTPVGGGWYIGALNSDNGTCGQSSYTGTMSSYGYPTGSSVGHVHLWARATPAALATSCQGSSGSCNFGGYGKANGAGQRGFAACLNCGSQATQSSMDFFVLNAGGSSGVGTTGGTTPPFQLDTGWHMWDYDYPTAGGNVTTSALYIDGELVNPAFYNVPSAIPATDNTACCTNSPEVRIGRTAAHAVSFFSWGQVAQLDIENVSLSAAYVSTRYNNESDPAAFYSLGAAVPVSTGASGQPVVSVITRLETPEDIYANR